MFNLVDFERLSPASFSGAGFEVAMSSARGGVKADAYQYTSGFVVQQR